MLYPLRFDPAMKDYLWGGRGLERLGKKLPEGVVAESWEISAHPDGLGVVAAGALSGKTLPELMREYGRELMGTALPETSLQHFPLLVKFIDANDKLSVQVHPDDAYASEHEAGSLGKTEMWVVLDAEPDARLVYGLKPGMTKELFAQAVRDGTVKDCLNEVPAKKGDVFDIPAGLVHAVGAGLLIVEIQQNSNTTYRVYDYDRWDLAGNLRPLHVEKALDVIHFGQNPDSGAACPSIPNGMGAFQTKLVKNMYFEVERIDADGQLLGNCDGTRFELFVMISGEAGISWSEGSLKAGLGESFLLPASLGKYEIKGSFSALRSWVP